MSSLYQIIKVQVCDGKNPKHKCPDPVGCISYVLGCDINCAHREAEHIINHYSKQCGICKWAVREKQ